MKHLKRLSAVCLVLGAVLVGIATASEVKLATAPTKTHSEAAAAISVAMRDHLYDPQLINQPAYKAIEAKVAALASQALSRKDFVDGFNAIWLDGPFSHVVLAEAEGSAAEMAAYFDNMRVGGGAARLTWQDNTAILTVNTMMGLDTIEEVDAAYEEIAKRQPKALIIDLRANKGGAFASRAIISHVINTPFDAGVFMSRAWYVDHRTPPPFAQVSALNSWQGWTVSSFWADVEANALTRVQLQPKAPYFPGKIFVLVSHQTASAAELTADALRSSGRAVLIGETTSGAMLSQSPYDLPDGLQVFLPIADYYAHKTGRIEGKGLQPDVAIAAEEAMTKALALSAKQ